MSENFWRIRAVVDGGVFYFEDWEHGGDSPISHWDKRKRRALVFFDAEDVRRTRRALRRQRFTIQGVKPSKLSVVRYRARARAKPQG